MDKETTALTTEIVQRWQLTRPYPPNNTKLTPRTVAAVLESLANGAPIAQACGAAGIAKTTLYEWQRKGEADPDSIYAEFTDLLEQARDKAEVDNVSVIKKAAETNWTAAAWLLERAYPQRWGRRDAQYIKSDSTHTLKIVFADAVKEVEEDEQDSDTDPT